MISRKSDIDKSSPERKELKKKKERGVGLSRGRRTQMETKKEIARSRYSFFSELLSAAPLPLNTARNRLAMEMTGQHFPTGVGIRREREREREKEREVIGLNDSLLGRA